MWRFIVGAIIPGLVLVLGETLTKALHWRGERGRKCIHVGAAFAAVSLAMLLPLSGVASLGIVFFFVLLLIRRYKIITALYDITRSSYGEVLFPLGVTAAALLAPTVAVYIAIMLIVGAADTAANVVGVRHGKHAYLFGNKTLEGSFAFFLVSCIILLIVVKLPIWQVGVTAVIATLAEAFSNHGLDNVSIPLFGGALLRVLV